jgi:hypothetical protein
MLHTPTNPDIRPSPPALADAPPPAPSARSATLRGPGPAIGRTRTPSQSTHRANLDQRCGTWLPGLQVSGLPAGLRSPIQARAGTVRLPSCTHAHVRDEIPGTNAKGSMHVAARLCGARGGRRAKSRQVSHSLRQLGLGSAAAVPAGGGPRPEVPQKLYMPEQTAKPALCEASGASPPAGTDEPKKRPAAVGPAANKRPRMKPAAATHPESEACGAAKPAAAPTVAAKPAAADDHAASEARRPKHSMGTTDRPVAARAPCPV